LVDAAEGPLPQTKFVLGKALKLGLRPIVVINKIDRQDARPEEVLNEIFDLFVAMDASDEQLDFPILYASGRNGWAVHELGEPQETLIPMFEVITKHVPAPKQKAEGPFSMLVTTLEYDPYLGRILTGRVETGSIKVNTPIRVLGQSGEQVEQGRIAKLLSFRGLERIAVDEAQAGDIIAIAGLEKSTVADTICAMDVTQPIKAQPIDPPTLAMTFSINDSPLAGQEGTKLTSRVLRERLLRESEGNVAIRITEATDRDAFEVAGRGELQLGVLIETMRREGFELSISRPRVLYKTDEATNQRLEPIEEIVIDVDEEYVGTVVESLSLRKAEMKDMFPSGGGKTRIVFHGPSRGLIGFHGQFLTITRGTGVMNRLFHDYAPFKGAIEGRANGVLISNGTGEAVGYALWKLEDRGIMFVEHGTKVYEGMIIGENNRDNDLEINPLRAKQLTNVRASGKDEAIRLTPPKVMTLEQAITYIEEDERVEVTPKSIRIRKAILDPNERKKFEKSRNKS
jgi:GTP-binding protein